jgi:hypothetical protein
MILTFLEVISKLKPVYENPGGSKDMFLKK